MSSARSTFEAVWFLPVVLSAGTAVAITVGGLSTGSDLLPLLPIAVVAGVIIGAVFLRIAISRDRTMDRVAGASSRNDSLQVTKQALRGDVPVDPVERAQALEIAEFWRARQRRFGRFLFPVWGVLVVGGLALLVVDFSIPTAIQVTCFSAVAILWWLQERQIRRRVQELRPSSHNDGQ